MNAEEVNVIKHLDGRIGVVATDFNMRAFPNPSQGQFVVETELPCAANIQIRILSLMGTEVMTLHNGLLKDGTHRFEISESNQLRSGVYFLQLNASPLDNSGTVFNKYQRLIISQ